MCLLIALHRVIPGVPLAVAANRDEFLARPARPMAVLRERGPRILGGRDELAGGTWFAVNEHGVVAGLTNFPTPVRDPGRRSRGELPLALAGHPDAAAAVEAFAARFRPADYNPAWILAGDRDALFYLDFTDGDRPRVRELPPGIHVLENRPLEAVSRKVAHVQALLDGAAGLSARTLPAFLASVLASHDLPPEPGPPPARPLALEAPCVHAGPYGTRSAAILLLRPDGGPPQLSYSEGPLCETPLLDAGEYWASGG